jgi:uncharacterized damage-inducible protein DinB
MTPNMKWFERSFPRELPSWMYATTLERLRGTPARLDERIATMPKDYLIVKPDNTWSIQENVGHLLDLEPLWSGRLDDILSGAEKLRPTDLANRATDLAEHNSKTIENLLNDFRLARVAFVDKLQSLSQQDLTKTALHPRLNTPMTIIDKMFFVAEHDDHHLARISAILQACSSS